MEEQYVVHVGNGEYLSFAHLNVSTGVMSIKIANEADATQYDRRGALQAYWILTRTPNIMIYGTDIPYRAQDEIAIGVLTPAGIEFVRDDVIEEWSNVQC